MAKYSVVLLRPEGIGGDSYISYVECNSIKEAISKARTEVFKVDEKEGFFEDVFVKPSRFDYKFIAIFEGHPKVVCVN